MQGLIQLLAIFQHYRASQEAAIQGFEVFSHFNLYGMDLFDIHINSDARHSIFVIYFVNL